MLLAVAKVELGFGPLRLTGRSIAWERVVSNEVESTNTIALIIHIVVVLALRIHI